MYLKIGVLYYGEGWLQEKRRKSQQVIDQLVQVSADLERMQVQM